MSALNLPCAVHWWWHQSQLSLAYRRTFFCLGQSCLDRRPTWPSQHEHRRWCHFLTKNWKWTSDSKQKWNKNDVLLRLAINSWWVFPCDRQAIIVNVSILEAAAAVKKHVNPVESTIHKCRSPTMWRCCDAQPKSDKNKLQSNKIPVLTSFGYGQVNSLNSLRELCWFIKNKLFKLTHLKNILSQDWNIW